MKIHTTNYTNTFIEIAEDCPAIQGEVPPIKGNTETIAGIQYDMISKNPYKYTSDDILFRVYAKRNDLTESEQEEARKEFFSKGQPCFRASPLTKRYGWGIHCDQNGKVAMYSYGTDEYNRHLSNKEIKSLKAMRSAK
jgi:hypothetical protein